MASATIEEIARLLDARFEGRGNLKVSRPVNPSMGFSGNEIAIATTAQYTRDLVGQGFKAAVLSEPDDWRQYGLEAAIFVRRPRLALSQITQHFASSQTGKPSIHPTAVIADSAQIGDAVSIGPFCVIGERASIGAGASLAEHVSIGPDATLGCDSQIASGVRISDNTAIGDRAIIHANAVIGADGFSFVTPEPGSVEEAETNTMSVVLAEHTALERIYSLGSVIVGSDVEIGAATTIDKGTLTDTVIGDGTKIDNQVQIGHNVTIGRNCMLCAQVGIAGSAQIGDGVVFGGKSGVADQVKIGSNVLIAAASAVGSDVASHSIMMGVPARKREEMLGILVAMRRLPKLVDTVAKMKIYMKKNGG